MTASYYNWLVNKIGGERLGYSSYSKLLHFLFREPFTWDLRIRIDESREEDGYELRYRYFDETGKRIDVSRHDNCSVLEMMIALSIRADRDIMWIPGEDHPERLFWEMLRNAGLLDFDDRYFNESVVYSVIDNILKRNYRPNGQGGFFPVRKVYKDMRTLPIWEQMNQYLNETYFVGRSIM